MSTQPVIAGFHACNNHAPNDRDRDIIRMTEAGAITFLTGMGQRFTEDDVKWALSINPKCHFFLREYLNPHRIGDKHDRSTWNYDALSSFFNECARSIEKYHPHIPEGQIHFQLFNEQNMPTWSQWEGFGDWPIDMRRFNERFVMGVSYLRHRFPNVKYGLSPFTPGNKDAWFDGDTTRINYYLHGPEAAHPDATQGDVWAAKESCLCKSAIEIADEYYFHIYIHEDNYAIDNLAYGLRYKRFLWFLPKKPYWFLECGYPNETMWRGDERLLNWFKLLDAQSADNRPDGVTFWILGNKEDWGNVFAPNGNIRPFVYDLKKYLNEREPVTPPDEPTPIPTPIPTPPDNKIEIPNQQVGMPLSNFKAYLANIKPYAEITKVFVHHTVNPTPEGWRGRHTMLAMKRVFEQRGWSAGPHIFVAPDGIWIFTPLNKRGVGVAGHNDNAIHVEIVGNYAKDPLEGNMLRKAVDTFGAVCNWLQYDPMDLCFHRDYGDTLCPGGHISEWFKYAVLNKLLVRETVKRIGFETIRVNEDAALYKYAHEHAMYAPLTNEFELCGRIVQGFAVGILSAKRDDWANMLRTNW